MIFLDFWGNLEGSEFQLELVGGAVVTIQKTRGWSRGRVNYLILFHNILLIPVCDRSGEVKKTINNLSVWECIVLSPEYNKL